MALSCGVQGAAQTWSNVLSRPGIPDAMLQMRGSLESPFQLQLLEPLRWKRRQHRRKPVSTISMVLPSGQPGRTAEHLKWSARAIKSFSMAELEARKLKYPTTGTEALLMGILTEGTSQAARFLRWKGVTLFGVRDEVIKLLGKADMYFFSPEHPPITEPAQKALDWALDEKARRGGEGEVTTAYMLLGIWAQKESAGYQVLTALGITEKLMEELANSLEPLAAGRA